MESFFIIGIFLAVGFSTILVYFWKGSVFEKGNGSSKDLSSGKGGGGGMLFGCYSSSYFNYSGAGSWGSLIIRPNPKMVYTSNYSCNSNDIY